MLAIAALSTLLISLSLIGNYQIKIEKMALQRKVDVDQIGELYIFHLETYPTETEFVLPSVYADQYVADVQGASLTVRRKNGSRSPLLYVEAERNDNGAVIVNAWRYSNISTNHQ